MDNKEAINWLTRIRDRLMTTSSKQFEAMTIAIAALEQQRLIPVKENPKKPKYQFDTYLVYTKYERFGIADYFADGSWIGYDIDGDPLDGGEITAWMPLPEPYQEDKE